jgi:hypothetical protein
MSNFPLFPLYENVLKKFDDASEDLTYEKKEEIVAKIKKMEYNDHEILYAIIKIYYLDHTENIDKEKFMKNPYNSKYMVSGIKFCIDDIPPGLQNIIYNFLFKMAT